MGIVNKEDIRGYEFFDGGEVVCTRFEEGKHTCLTEEDMDRPHCPLTEDDLDVDKHYTCDRCNHEL